MYHPDQQFSPYLCPRHGISSCDECPDRPMSVDEQAFQDMVAADQRARAEKRAAFEAELKKVRAVCATHQKIYVKEAGCPACAEGAPKVVPINPFGFLTEGLEITFSPEHLEEIRRDTINTSIRYLVDQGYEVSHPVSLDPDHHKGRNPGSPRFMELLKSMKDTHIAKNAGYAGADNPDFFANFRDCEGIGISAFMGALVRMGDKWSRIKSLARDPSNERVGEAITDTLIDLANYALIAICLYEQQCAAAEKPAEPEPEYKGILQTLTEMRLRGRK